MFRLLITAVLLFGTSVLTAQRTIRKTFLNKHASYIQIDAKLINSLVLNTTNQNEIVLTGEMDGEYAEEILINIEEEGSTLLISTDLNPNFLMPNDKLSAHKVISIDLAIDLPPNLSVSVYGSSAMVDAAGNYRKLDIGLADGHCSLDVIGEEISVQTHSGDINVWAKEGQVDAKSTYGEVTLQNVPSKGCLYRLYTHSGKVCFGDRTPR